MKARLQGNLVEVIMLLVGQLGALAAYGLFLGEIALGSGPSAPLPLILVAGIPIAAGVGLNHVAAEGAFRRLFAAWSVLLAPLLAIWLYASLRPAVGDAGATTTAIDVLLLLVILGGVAGTWGFLRVEERRDRDVVTGAVWAVAALLAIATMIAGHPDGLVVAAFALGFIAQLATFDALRRESGWTVARPAPAS